MTSKIKYSSLLVLFFMLFMSCVKEPGEGGTASIQGHVMVKVCGADTTQPYASYMARDEEVYIVYGDDETYGDKQETHANGTYLFNFLNKGNYVVFAYSDNYSNEKFTERDVVKRKVHISKRGEKVQVPLITIYKSVDNYEGTSLVKGSLFAYDWNAELTYLKDSFYVKNEYVYIARQADHYYFDRVRTYYDGSFVFPSLPIGKYEVYAYGRDLSAQDPQDEVPTVKKIEITENAQVKDIGRLEIIK